MQQSGRDRGIRSVGAIVCAAWGLWLTGCAPEDDWELTEIGVEQERAELAGEEAWLLAEDEVEQERAELAGEEAGLLTEFGVEQEMAELAGEEAWLLAEDEVEQEWAELAAEEEPAPEAAAPAENPPASLAAHGARDGGGCTGRVRAARARRDM